MEFLRWLNALQFEIVYEKILLSLGAWSEKLNFHVDL